MRATPYDLAFGPGAEPAFERIRASLAATGRDPHDPDGFVLDREVVQYLRELVPEEGVGEGMAQHVALLHHAWLYWAEGAWLVSLAPERARRLLTEPAAPVTAAAPRAYYVQLPERLLWADLGDGEPHQPLDGLFVRPWPGGGYFALAVFGLHPGQGGFSVVDADGFPPDEPSREDGSPWFAPVMEGGARAGLFSVLSGDELLELAARTAPLAAELAECAGPAHRPHQPLLAG